MKKSNCYILVLLMIISFANCTKESNPAAVFYGIWKTSYGDTIVFATRNGRDEVNYDAISGSATPIRVWQPFAYRDDKLGVLVVSGMAVISFFDSFKWIEPGRSFEVKSGEWFLHLRSTSTTFTYTKISP